MSNKDGRAGARKDSGADRVDRNSAKAQRKQAEAERSAAEVRQKAAEAKQKAAEAEQRTAEALQKVAEAEQRTAEAKLSTAAAAAHAARNEAEAEAAHQASLVASRQHELESRSAAAVAERALANVDRTSNAELRQKIAEADAAAVKAYLPTESTLQPLEGDVTADSKSGVVGDGLAMSLVGPAFSSLLADETLQVTDSARVLVVSDQAFAASDWNHHAVDLQIRQIAGEVAVLKEQLSSPLPPPAPPAAVETAAEGDGESNLRSLIPIEPVSAGLAIAGAVPSIVGAAADIAGYFQSNYTISGREVTVEQSQVVATCVAALRARNPDIGVYVDGFHVIPTTEIMGKYSDMVDSLAAMIGLRFRFDERFVGPAAAEVERRSEELKLAIEAQARAALAEDADEGSIAAAAAEVAKLRLELRAAEAEHGRLVGVSAAASAVATRAEAFIASATTVPANGGLPPLGVAATRELLHTGPSDGEGFTHLLHVSVGSIGTESQIRKRRFRAPVIRYLSSCTVAFTLVETDGRVVSSGSKSVLGQLAYTLDTGSSSRVELVDLPTGIPAPASTERRAIGAAPSSS